MLLSLLCMSLSSRGLGASGKAPQEQLGSVAQTCRRVAAARALESERLDATHHDPYAALLAGEGLLREGRSRGDFSAQPAPGAPHSGMAMRATILDDEVVAAVSLLLETHSVVQVINLGAGMDTRPWRLSGLESVRWFEVDVPEVLELKAALLSQYKGSRSSASEDGGGDDDVGDGSATTGQPPLKVAKHVAVPFDLRNAKQALCSTLKAVGFDVRPPSIWILEGVIYYLDAADVQKLLSAVADCEKCSENHLSASEQLLVTTIISRQLLLTWRQSFMKEVKGSPNLFKCCFEELAGSGVFENAGWQLLRPAATVPALARERYRAELHRREGLPAEADELIVLLKGAGGSVNGCNDARDEL